MNIQLTPEDRKNFLRTQLAHAQQVVVQRELALLEARRALGNIREALSEEDRLHPAPQTEVYVRRNPEDVGFE